MNILNKSKKIYFYIILITIFTFMPFMEGRSELYDFEKEDFLKVELQGQKNDRSQGLTDSDKLKNLLEKEIDTLNR